MPQVPVYGGNQVAQQPQQGGYLDAGQFTGGARNLAAVGQGLADAGATADRISIRESQRIAYDTQAGIQAKWLDQQQQWLTQRKNDAAKGLTNDTSMWWAKAAEEAAPNLDPYARALVTRQLQQSSLQAQAMMGHFENQQLDAAADLSMNAAKATSISTATAAPFVMVPSTDADGKPTTITSVEATLKDLRAKNAEAMVRKGIADPTVLSAMNLADSTKLHTQVLQGLSRTAPDQARAYYEQYKDQIDGTQHAEISHQLDVQGNLAKAQAIGAQLAQQFGYTQTGEAQKAIDAMDVSPEQKTAIRQEVEHRHAIQQSDADKAQALGVGKVMESVYGGASKAQILASPEYQALRDKGAVLKAIDDHLYTQDLRANASDARAMSKLARHERELEMTQAGAAFAYSDPVVLAGTPREKIAAQLPTLGRQWTEYLLQKKDSLVKSDAKVREAKMDQDDFNQVADSMGMHPLKATSESEKRDLLTLKASTEQLIDQWQAKNGREMPREEKKALMQKAIATQITTSGMIWNSNTSLLQVPEKDIGKVIVPDLDRGQIIIRLRQVKGDANYMPTPQEIGQAYLMKQRRGVVNGQ